MNPASDFAHPAIIIGTGKNRSDSHRERHDQNAQENNRHRRNRQRAFVPQPLLKGDHEGPGRHHDGCRPDGGPQKWPQDPERRTDETHDENHGQQASGQIALGFSHYPLLSIFR